MNQNELWIKNANIITCNYNNDEIIKNANIGIRDGKIYDIAEHELPAHALHSNVFDAEGKFISPGLIDCHVHIHSDAMAKPTDVDSKEMHGIRSVQYMQCTLESGFTTVRSMGGPPDVEVAVKKAVDSGIVKGPDLLISGVCMTITGGHMANISYRCDSYEAIEKYVQSQIDQDVDYIKVLATGGVSTPGDAETVQFDLAQLELIVKMAHDAGKKVAAHCIGAKGTLYAAMAGVDTIEHGAGMDEKALEYIVKNDIWYVPVLLPSYAMKSSPGWLHIPEPFQNKIQEYQDNVQKAVKLAKKAGVKIAMGTDCGSPLNLHGTNAQEIVLLSENGLTPLESIHSATIDAAKMLGLNKSRGSIEIGKNADLIIVNDNPLENIRTLCDVRHVIKGGVIYK